jgi:cation diffusion facilitator family transporter
MGTDTTASGRKGRQLRDEPETPGQPRDEGEKGGGEHGSSQKAIFAALLANLGIALTKFIAFLITTSSSMLAESIHSLADTGNQGLLLLGRKGAEKPADETHPFGYGRVRYVYAFLVAVVLFTVGGLFAIYEGYEKIRHPHELESAIIAVGVLVVAIILEGFSLRTAIKETAAVKGEQGYWSFIKTSRIPELPVVLLEDTAALTGLVFALGGVGLALGLDEPRWDGVGTLAIGVLLVVVAVILGVQMKGMLVGESALPHEVETIRTALRDAEGVSRIINLRTLHLGPEELLVAAKIETDRDADLTRIAAIIDGAEKDIRTALPTAKRIFLEPDLLREDLQREGAAGQ